MPPEGWQAHPAAAAAAREPGEETLYTQKKVGLYQDETRLVAYDSGIAHVTTHAVWWQPERDCEALRLALPHIVAAELVTGGITASAKIVLKVELRREPAAEWRCAVCDAVCDGSRRVCANCGVARSSTVNTDATACPACTFDNAPSSSQCTMCGTALTKSVAKTTVKLSFRGGGHAAAFQALQRALALRKWAAPAAVDRSGGALGVAGIARESEARSQQESAALETGFRDLASLEAMASDLVTLAQVLAPEKPAGASAGEPAADDGANLGALLRTLGIENPVTQLDGGGRDSYVARLARELATFLDAAMPRVAPHTGVLALADVFCMFNRARGVALVSPQDLIEAARQLSELKLPYQIRKFPRSGLVAVQAVDSSASSPTGSGPRSTRLTRRLMLHMEKAHSGFSDAADDGARRACLLAMYSGGAAPALLTARLLAERDALNPILVEEELLWAESQGLVVRDETSSGLFFAVNIFG